MNKGSAAGAPMQLTGGPIDETQQTSQQKLSSASTAQEIPLHSVAVRQKDTLLTAANSTQPGDKSEAAAEPTGNDFCLQLKK